MMISLVTCDIHGRNPAHVVDSLSHYLQGFMHPFGGCLGFFSINSMEHHCLFLPEAHRLF